MFKVLVYSTKNYEKDLLLKEASRLNIKLEFTESPLDSRSVLMAKDFEAVSIFVNDTANRNVLEQLESFGVKYLSLRSAGFNQVDLTALKQGAIRAARVPAYSPNAVAEHAFALILCLNRKIHKAYNRVREGNFSLDGLMGFDLKGKSVGVLGTGQIGTVFAKIARGFSCHVIAHDKQKNKDLESLGIQYVSKEDLLAQSDILSLHCPLTEDTKYFINEDSLKLAKPGMLLINTSRGALIDSKAVISALKQGTLSGLGIDVYEEEENLFFKDHSSDILVDDVFARLTTFPNVLITGHQAFLTREALEKICQISLQNLCDFREKGTCQNEVL